MVTLPQFNLTDSIAVLTRTPATLDALLRGLPDIWVRRNEGSDGEGPVTKGKPLGARSTSWAT